MIAERINPFTPVFGKVPPHMAGRSDLIDAMKRLFEYPFNDPASTSLLVGARGTGKTSLLLHYCDLAESNGWVTANVVAAPDMLEQILEQARKNALHLVEPRPRRALKSVEISGIGSISWENEHDDATSWRMRITDLLEELARTDTGLLITVDELDPDLEQMTTLATTVQQLLGENRKVALAMAGLPHAASTLLSGKSTSFLRRADTRDLRAIEDYEAADAFRLTVEGADKTIGPDALSRAVDSIGGYPYLFQLLGYRAWELAIGSDEITAGHIEAASATARRELESRVYDATYNELSDADCDFLHAMLGDDRRTRQADLAQRLGKNRGHVSKYKKRLLEEGIIREVGRGYLEFCLPGFREYFARREAEFGL